MAKKKTFIFDFDSTLFPGESLDEIILLQLESETNNELKKKEITHICNLGMSGTISMEQSLQERLIIGAPTPETIAHYVIENKNRIDHSISTLLKQLHDTGHKVFVISGGFEEWIKPLLNGIVHSKNIYANQIKDKNLPMRYENIIRKDKETIIRGLKDIIADSDVIMVGDGATDFSVYNNGLATQFIGTFYYTGVISRKKILDLANKYEQNTFDTLANFVRYIQAIYCQKAV